MNILWLLFLVAAVIETLGGISWTEHQQSIGLFLVATVGMNSTHVGLTALLLKLPEYNNELETRKRLFYSKWPLVFCITVAVAVFSLCVSQVITLGNHLAPDRLANSLYQMLLVFHAVMQTKGLALLYFSGTPQSQIERKYFGWGFGCLFLVSALVTFFEIYAPLTLDSTIQAGAFIFLIGCCVAIFKKGLSLNNSKRSSFLFFSGRLVLWPLSVYSFSALLGVLAIHGLEYGFITYRMISRSRISKEQISRLKLGAVFSILFFTILSLGIPSWNFSWNQGVSFTDEKPLILKALFSTLIFLTIMHIVIDSFIFRFRNSKLAHSVKPLLLDSEQAVSLK